MLALCSGHKINYSIYGGGRVKGCDFSGIPKVFVFNWEGKLKWDGRHDGMESAIDVNLMDAPDWLVGPRNYKAVKSEADKLRKRKSMGAATKALRKKAESDDPAEKEEAAELLARVLKYVARERARADACVEAGDPLKAQGIWKRLAKNFKGDEAGDAAAALEKEKKKDASFKRELAAAKIVAKMEAVADRIKPRRSGEARDKWRTKNAGMLGKILGLFKSLEKKYEDTKVYERARAMAKGLGLI
ncbi:MAG: hypothetical protein ACYS47_13870 [Planctomycetota bacterium]